MEEDLVGRLTATARRIYQIPNNPIIGLADDKVSKKRLLLMKSTKALAWSAMRSEEIDELINARTDNV